MNIGVLMASLGADVGDLKKATKHAESLLKNYEKETGKSLDKVDKQWKKSSDSISNSLKGIGKAIAVYLSIRAISDFGKSILEAGVRVQSLENSFKAITGSMYNAKSEMQFVKDTAYDLGLNVKALEDSFKTLAAASMKTTLEGEGARDVFYAVAEASTAMQLTATQTHAALYALQQMMSKGSVQMEELRRQLGEQLPGAFQMAAEAMGVTTKQLAKMLELGQLAATDFLPKFAKVLHERFGLAAVKNAELARGAFNRFRNEVDYLKRSLAAAGFTDFFANIAKTSTILMQDLRKDLDINKKELTDFFKEVGDGFENLLKDIDTKTIIESLRSVGTVLEDIKIIFLSLPAEITSALGVGVVGRFLFGGTVGIVLGTLTLTNSALRTLGLNLDDLKKKHYDTGNAIIKLYKSIANEIRSVSEVEYPMPENRVFDISVDSSFNSDWGSIGDDIDASKNSLDAFKGSYEKLSVLVKDTTEKSILVDPAELKVWEDFGETLSNIKVPDMWVSDKEFFSNWKVPEGLSEALDKINDFYNKALPKEEEKLLELKENYIKVLGIAEKFGLDKTRIVQSYEAQIAEIEKSGNDKRIKEEEKAAKEVIKLREKLESEINRSAGDAYNYGVELLDKEYEKRKEILGDSLELNEWYYQQLMELGVEYSNQNIALYKELYAATGLEEYAERAINEYEKILDASEDTWRGFLINENDIAALRTSREKEFAKDLYSIFDDIVDKEATTAEERLKIIEDFTAARLAEESKSASSARDPNMEGVGYEPGTRFSVYQGQVWSNESELISYIENQTKELESINKNTLNTSQLAEESAQREIQRIYEERKAAVTGQYDKLVDWLIGKERADWDISDWNDQFSKVQTYAEGLDSSAENYYENGLSALENMVDILMKIDSLEEQQLSEQKKLTDTLLGSIKTIDDAVISLMGGDLAPVSSKEFFTETFGDKLAAAIESPENIGDLTSFVTGTFLPFMKTYYADTEGYTTVFDNVLAGFDMLKNMYGTEWVDTVGGTKISYDWNDMVSFPDPTEPGFTTIYLKDEILTLPDKNVADFIEIYKKDEIFALPVKDTNLITTYYQGDMFTLPERNALDLINYLQTDLYSLPDKTKADFIEDYKKNEIFSLPDKTQNGFVEDYLKNEIFTLPDKDVANFAEEYKKGDLFTLPNKNVAGFTEVYLKGELFTLPDKNVAGFVEDYLKNEIFTLPDKNVAGFVEEYKKNEIFTLPKKDDPEPYNWIDVLSFVDSAKIPIDWSEAIDYDFQGLSDLMNSAFGVVDTFNFPFDVNYLGDIADGITAIQLAGDDISFGTAGTYASGVINGIVKEMEKNADLIKSISFTGSESDLEKFKESIAGFSTDPIKEATSALDDLIETLGLVPSTAQLIIDKMKAGSTFETAFKDTVGYLTELETPIKDVGDEASKADDSAANLALSLFASGTPFKDVNDAVNLLSGNVKAQLTATIGFFESFAKGLGMTFAGGELGTAVAGEIISGFETAPNKITYAWVTAGMSAADMWGHKTPLWQLVNSLGDSVGGIVASDNIPQVPMFAEGGLTNGMSIVGEIGPEWVIPTYEPQRSSFLKDVGVDPEIIGKSISNSLGTGSKDITVNIIIDGQVVNTVVKRGLSGEDTDLIEMVRSI